MDLTTTPPTKCTVLFADVAGSTQLYGTIGDKAAYEMVDTCIQAITRSIEDKNGQIIKHTGDGLMAVFQDPNHAVEATLAMHVKLREMASQAAPPLAIRVGFHFGDVIFRENDVFGDTVNQAARLAEIASPGRALTTHNTAAKLGPEWLGTLQSIPARILRGTSSPVELFEIKCDSVGEVTLLHSPALLFNENLELRLYFGKQVIIVDISNPIIHIGRDASADITVPDSRVSRKHADIELRGDKFVLVDRSSNGTYIAIEGEKEYTLSREEAVLHNKGQISFGVSCRDNPLYISFVCM